MFPPAFDAVALIGQVIARAALDWAAALRGTSVSLVEVVILRSCLRGDQKISLPWLMDTDAAETIGTGIHLLRIVLHFC